MAKIKNPLHSMTAHGTVGDQITFRETMHGAVATRYPKHTPSASDDQEARREQYRDGCAAWQILDPTGRLPYEALAKKLRVTAFNAFMSEYMQPITPPPPTVWATLDPATITPDLILSNGNLTVSWPGGSAWRQVKSTQLLSTRKCYFEIHLDTFNFQDQVGIINNQTLQNFYLGGDNSSSGLNLPNGHIYYNNNDYAFIAGASNGDTIGLNFDPADQSVIYTKNGTVQGTSTRAVAGPIYAIAAMHGNGVMTFNFGATAFSHAPEASYAAGVYA